MSRPTLSDAVAAMLFSADSDEHAFDHGHDGDGWNEPFSDDYSCLCGDWSLTWVQSDPGQTDRPDPADALLAWFAHYEQAYSDPGWPDEPTTVDHPDVPCCATPTHRAPEPPA